MPHATSDFRRHSRRFRRLTLRSAVLLIAVIACGLGAYRYYERHIKKRTVAYPVAELISGRRAPATRNPADLASLAALIRSEVSPGSWQGQGGSGTIVEFFLDNSVIVRNNDVVHERLTAFLREKRAAREGAEAPEATLHRTPPAE
jgi:hypothetical protein